jgi:hypothetical protein
MKMNKAAMVMCAALTLSGCGGFAGAYQGPGTADERAQVFADCRAKVDQSTILAVEDENGTLFSRARGNLLQGCMEGHGYRLTPNFQAAL